MTAANSDLTARGVPLAWRITKLLWIGLAVLILAVSLRAYDDTPNSDAEELLAWGMLTLSVPAGLLYSAAFAVVASLLYSSSQTVISTSYLSMCISWVALFVLGYSQWFVLAPWGIRKLRAGK
jgi:uncharacterized oligopeptide transporter (OPT) family protein